MAGTGAVEAPAAPGQARETSGGEPLVALVGPPNSGKTTLYNQLTGLRQKTANYPGVTVEKHVGFARLGEDGGVDLVDLPGVNGFSARTLDERVHAAEGRAADEMTRLHLEDVHMEIQRLLEID